MDLREIGVLAAVMICAGYIGFQRARKKKLQKRYLDMQLQKGREGEEDTARYLEKIRGYKRLLFNVYIPRYSGTDTTELDIVMVHEKGIFVIENKNYAGWIMGKEEDERWVQILGKKRNYFYNPVRQNRFHIISLKRLVSSVLPFEVPYLSVITFNSQARLKRISVYSDKTIVTYGRTVKRKIRKMTRRMDKVLNREEVDELYRVLKGDCHGTKKIRKEHAKQIRRIRRESHG